MTGSFWRVLLSVVFVPLPCSGEADRDRGGRGGARQLHARSRWHREGSGSR